jgi:hypothetical protein
MMLIDIRHKGISIKKSTYRGILNNSFGTSRRKLGAILWRDSVIFGKNFSDGQILSAILYESRSKLSHLGRRDVLLLDSKRQYIYAYTPHHKFFEVVQPFTASDPAEVKRLVDMITPLLVGATKDPTDKRNQIFSECVHIAMDNHFSGDDVLRYLGEGGWKGTMTCRCNRLPKSVSRKYFNFIKAAPVNARSKVARFEQPIIAG